MCGIFGAVAYKGTLGYADSNFLKAATVTGQLRGEDGTGFMMQSPSKETRVYKRALCGNDFLYTRQGKDADNNFTKCRVVVGHNRKTTSGKNTDLDCHPYEYDNVIGVHNGTLPYHVISRLPNTDNTVADVDSAKVYAALDSVEDPIEVLSKIHTGSYALIWIDKRTNMLHAARNDDRPLWAVNGDDGLYFASEPGMLFWLVSRYSLDAPDSKIFSLATNHLYSLDLENPTKIGRTEYTVESVTSERSKSGFGSANDRAMDAWGVKGTTPVQPLYKHLATPEDVKRVYPSIGYYGDIIRAHMDYIRDMYLRKDKAERASRCLDVAITHVTPARSTGYVTMHGFLLDEEESSGQVVPVLFSGCKEGEYNLIKRFKKAADDDTFFTVRAVLGSIKVNVDGTIVACATLLTVWDTKHNVARDAGSVLAATQVADVMRPKNTRLTTYTLKNMWEKLEAPLTQH